MPDHRPSRPSTRSRNLAPVADDFTQRQLSDATQRAADQIRDRNGLYVSLAVGVNVINHGLGRKPRGAQVTPTVANATWAYALTSADTKQATLTCIGVAQPNAYVEFS